MRREEIEDHLHTEVKRTQSQYEIARAEFKLVITDIPSGLPQPDGTQRIHNVARDYRAEREAFQKALDRFNDFILRGKIPEDLGQTFSRAAASRPDGGVVYAHRHHC